MLKEKACRACVFILPVVLLLACSVSGIPAPEGDEQETPTGANLGAGGDSDSGGAGANNGGAGGGNVDSVVESVPYGIYVKAVVSGKCGAYTNSGGFKDMELEAGFEGMVFVRPMGTGIPGPFGGLNRKTEPSAFSMTGLFLSGHGNIQSVHYCPVYETEELSYPVNIISGPNPLETLIAVKSPTALDSGAGTAPTKTPVGGGEAWIMFSIGRCASGGPILEYEVRGDKGAEDELSLGNPVRFVTTWDQLMKGEKFTIEMTGGDEGETWKWTMEFYPDP